MTTINGATRVCGLFGDPVAHSFSPAMHNAAFKELGLNYLYIPFQVKAQRLGEAVSALRALNLAGVNVTVPHKQAVGNYLDWVSPEAGLMGAVNTIVHKEGRLLGFNTDGPGFIRSLSAEAGFMAAGRVVLILGAGGAARAVAVAAALNGAAEIIVANRSLARAAELSALIGGKTGCAASVLNWYEQGQKNEGWEEVLARANLVVQTTTVGMHPNHMDFPPFPCHLLSSRHLVVDLVYNPPVTEFLKRCSAAGSVVYSGLGMLLYQGALAFEMWTGLPAPVELMKKIIEQR